MNCPYCSEQIEESDRFCGACGKSLSESGNLPSGEVDNRAADGAAQPILVCRCPEGESEPDEDGFCKECGVKCVPSLPAHTVEISSTYLAMVSDIGKRHKTNDDAGAVAAGERNSVLVVADGVSSSVDGASGSAMAVKVMREMLLSCKDPSEAEAVMGQAIEAAHNAIVKLPFASSDPDADGPETTVVAAIRQAGQLTIGWVGDSRAYRIGENSEDLLTVDDSWVELVVASGELTREEAAADKRAHYVTQVVGMRDGKIGPHVIRTDVTPGKMLLLCSDGLWNYFQEPGKLLSAINEYGPENDAADICTHLVAQAYEQGGHDNITVALLKM